MSAMLVAGFIPFRIGFVYVTGVLEIIGAIFLLIPAYKILIIVREKFRRKYPIFFFKAAGKIRQVIKSCNISDF